MARLEWDAPGLRMYETGTDRGVLYVGDKAGVPWVGLVSVEETPTGGEPKAYYMDGVKYMNAASAEEYEATINAFTYPELFTECDGTSQPRKGLFVTYQRRKPFGFSYRTLVGNDLSSEAGYKLHIVYGALASPSPKTHTTTSDSPEPTTFSWKITTKPPAMAGFKRTAHIVLDSRTTDVVVMNAVEDALYGDEATSAYLPTLAQLIDLYDELVDLVVVDNGDGTFTATGPSSVLQVLNNDTWQISSPDVELIDDTLFSITTA